VFGSMNSTFRIYNFAIKWRCLPAALAVDGKVLGNLLIHRHLLCVLCALLLALYGSAVCAATLCQPKDNSARILTKPSPNAVHPDWRGDNFIGTGWSFLPRRSINTITGDYAQGSLRGSRGGIVNRGVYILLSEWNCSTGEVQTSTRSASSAFEWPVYISRILIEFRQSGARNLATPGLRWAATERLGLAWVRHYMTMMAAVYSGSMM
jgi:hypothetical protein